jgi:hypothetical protein
MSTREILIKQLEGAPESEIIGVVHARGVGGSGGGLSSDDDQWTLHVNFSGWKPLGGELRKSEITLLKEVPKAAIQKFMADMKPFDVVRVRARWMEDTVFGSPQALLTELIGRDDSDSELNAYAQELLEPVTYEDPLFGVFTLNRSVGCYEARPDWSDVSIDLIVHVDTPDQLEKSLVVARKLWGSQAEWQRRISACATKKLLGLKNKSWLQEGEAEVSEAEFERRMDLDMISVEADGSFEFWHNDDDLFWGHAIMVSGNLEEGPKDADICG